MPKKRRAKGAGTVRKLPSGRWQARFLGPDDVLRPAPTTFDTKLDANAWLRRQADDVHAGIWQPPSPVGRQPVAVTPLREYAEAWLDTRELKPRTRAEYRRVLDTLVLPDLGDVPLNRITPATVRTWFGSLDPAKPTRRAHAYGLLRTIFTSAVSDDLVQASPCRIRGGGRARKQHRTSVATLPELEVIVAAMPDRLRFMTLLAAWCGLRFGELTELRRHDVDLDTGSVRVDRGVTRVGSEFVVGPPKSEAGRRSVSIPPHLVEVASEHLRRHTGTQPDALLFPSRSGGHLTASTLHKLWSRARAEAGREDLRFHDLRHTGATLAAATGATLADLMKRLGHSTAGAAMIYQHAASDRDRAIAEALSGFAEAKVIPLRPTAAS